MLMAAIVPQVYLHLTSGDEFHMALAHLINKPGLEIYTHHFKEMSEKKKFVLLDNGAFEGELLPIAEVCNKAEAIGATEIILPDDYKNAEATKLLTRDAVKYLNLRYNGLHNLPFRLMAVPQGVTIEEWVECAAYIMHNIPGIKTIGVPKHLIDSCKNRDARLWCLLKLQEMYPDVVDKFDYHLLGCWKTPIEVMSVNKAAHEERIPMVRSCDSAIAYVYARNGIRFCEDDRPDNLEIPFTHGKIADELLLGINLIDWQNVGDITHKTNMFTMEG